MQQIFAISILLNGKLKKSKLSSEIFQNICSAIKNYGKHLLISLNGYI